MAHLILDGHTLAQTTSTFSWWDWHLHPDVILGVVLFQGLYLLGVGPLRRRYGWAPTVETRQVALFSLGVLVLFVSLTSPIHHLSDSFLFSAHMVQHLLLMLVTPSLLIAGTPGWLLRPMVRSPQVLATARLLTRPVIALIIFSFVMSVWHLPALYDLTLRNHGVHILEHLLFISAAVIMWWPVLSPLPEVPRATYPIQMVYLFFLSLPPGFIGAAITFSHQILYSYYDTVPRLWGTTALADQQVGGLIMKIPGGLTFLGALTVVFFIWFNREERGEIEEWEQERTRARLSELSPPPKR